MADCVSERANIGAGAVPLTWLTSGNRNLNTRLEGWGGKRNTMTEQSPTTEATMKTVTLAWFRRDLRLHDNPAWAKATKSTKVVALVVIEPQLLASAGSLRQRAYLAALVGLDQSLRELGGSLWVGVGDPASVVPRVACIVGAEEVCVNSDVTRWSRARDRRVRKATEVPLNEFWGTVVHPPGTVLTAAGRFSKVFTPFYRSWQSVSLRAIAHAGTAAVVPAPAEFSIDAFALTVPVEAEGEQSALHKLNKWLERVDRYDENRDLFHLSGTSELSAALHFGQLSPRHMVEAVGTHTPGRAAFVRQLAWRDWYIHLTAQQPNIDRECLKPQYERIEWSVGCPADETFEAWCEGTTGYPIVDAAMRELTATGWMHNRLRLVTASFLVKHLLIDWRRGERWFRRLLIDGDIAQNAGNWQWVAGVGTDSAPYFRIFNPVLQSKKFDPKGHYLRRRLPELANLRDADIHAPWQASPLDLAAAGVTLGVTYPNPIVDHAEARERVLKAYRKAEASEL